METILYNEYRRRYAENSERARRELRACLEPSVRTACKASGAEFAGVDESLIDACIQRIVERRGEVVGGIEFWLRKTYCIVRYTQDDGFPELTGQDNVEAILSIEAHTPFSEIFNVEEAAKRWGLSQTELNRAIEDGEFMTGLQYLKIDGATLISQQAMRYKYGASVAEMESGKEEQDPFETLTLAPEPGVPKILTDLFGEDADIIEIV